MMVQAKNDPKEQCQLLAILKAVINNRGVPARPDRGESRAARRRPKNYQLMTLPRNEMTERIIVEDTVIREFNLVPFRPNPHFSCRT